MNDETLKSEAQAFKDKYQHLIDTARDSIDDIDPLDMSVISSHESFRAESLTNVMEIISRYTENTDFDVEQGNSDLVRLAANNFFVGRLAGILRGAAKHNDTWRRIRKSQAAVHVKRANKNFDQPLKLTEKDVENISSMAVEEIVEKIQRFEAVADAVNNAHYDASRFAGFLDSVTKRNHENELRFFNRPPESPQKSENTQRHGKPGRNAMESGETLDL